MVTGCDTVIGAIYLAARSQSKIRESKCTNKCENSKMAKMIERKNSSFAQRVDIITGQM